jgi:hypothetical protein
MLHYITVGFSGEFESFQDAMVTLSWMDSKQQSQIYQLYLELQTHAAAKHGQTSHDYVTRVIAQKYNITQERVAAIVQLQHNEQQYKREGRPLLTQAAEYMDAAIQQEISEAYQSQDSKAPEEFIEDPVGVTGELRPRRQWQVVEDVFDVDQLLADAVIRDEKEARIAIEGYRFIEDVDDEAIEIKMSKDAKKLVKQHEQLHKASPQADSQIEWPLPANGEGEKRPRWKFVAQVVNTRDLKRKHSVHRSYTNNSPENTLVEQDGTLRIANMADVKQVSWKPVRNVREHIYSGAKKAWLDHNVRNQQNVWGKAPDTVAIVVPPKVTAKAEEAASETDESVDMDTSSSISESETAPAVDQETADETTPDATDKKTQ